MGLSIRTRYWDDPKARGAFKEFMIKIFDLDFSEWDSRGYWDNAFAPFSFFHGDEVVSSVCVYSLEAVVDGEATRVAQISSVGTLPEWRRRGLGRRLTDAGLDWARESHDGVFLFADQEAIPFYVACGFRQAEEHVEFIEARPVGKSGEPLRLDPGRGEDLDRIYSRAQHRDPISDRFSVLNEKLLMFHCLYRLRNRIYEIPDLDCVVFFERDDGCLRIFDIVSEKVPRFQELYPYISDENDRTIEFHFHSDKLGLDAVNTRPLKGNNLFVKDPFPIENPVFPFTSRA